MKLKTGAALGAAAVAALVPSFASADGHYVPGVEGIQAASAPPPGVYYLGYLVDYRMDSFRAPGLSSNLPGRNKGSVTAFTNRLVWITQTKVLGADYGMEAVIPVLRTSLNLQAAGISDTHSGLGDIYLGPLVLGWHGSQWDAAAAAGVWLDNASTSSPAAPGKGFKSTMLSGGMTYYFDRAKTITASGLVRFERNGRNGAGLRPGNQVSLEWGLGKNFGVVQAGLVGYKQVGQRARCQSAQAAALTKDFGAHHCGAGNHVGQRQHLRAQAEFVALQAVGFAQQVGAEAHLHTCRLEYFERAQPGAAHVLHLGHARGWQAERCALVGQRVIGDHCGHHVGAQLRHQRRCRRVDQVAVLDGAHAAAHGARDRGRGVGMGQHIGVARGGLGDDGADLVLAVAQGIDRVGGRGHAARGHDLDLVGPHLQFFAGGLAHRVHAIDHPADHANARAVGADHVGCDVVGASAAVGMAAGLAQRTARDEQPRPLGQARLNRLLERMAGTARVAHGGEAAAQHATQDRQAAQRRQHIRHVNLLLQVELECDHMHVQVDQARHHRLAARVDDPRIAGCNGLVGHLADGVAFDQDVVLVQQFGLQRVEQAGVLDECGLGHRASGAAGQEWTISNSTATGACARKGARSGPCAARTGLSSHCWYDAAPSHSAVTHIRSGSSGDSSNSPPRKPGMDAAHSSSTRRCTKLWAASSRWPGCERKVSNDLCITRLPCCPALRPRWLRASGSWCSRRRSAPPPSRTAARQWS